MDSNLNNDKIDISNKTSAINNDFIDISDKIDLISLLDNQENSQIKNEGNDDEDNSKETLTDTLQAIIKSTSETLQLNINLKAIETVSASTCVKQLSIEGKINKEMEQESLELQNIIKAKLTQKMGHSFIMSQFWMVFIGLKEGERFTSLDCLDLNGEKNKIVHEEGNVLIIDFWSIYSELDHYLLNNIEIMKNIIENKTEGVIKEKIKYISISGEEYQDSWKEYASSEDLNKYIPQYNSLSIYEDTGIRMIPSILIINQKGIIKYIGIYKELDLEQSLKNLFSEEIEEEKKIIIKKLEPVEDFDNNPNAWWLDLDAESKVDIVRSINLTLRSQGTRSSSFSVVTKYIHYKDKIKSYTVPMFTGAVSEEEYDLIQTMAVTLQNDWCFNNFQFNVRIMAYY